MIGFGRRAMEIRKDELENYVLYQVGALYGMAKTEGIELQHVKPHGALYNMAWVRTDYAEAVVAVIASFNPELILMAPYGSKMYEVANKWGIKVAFEYFADRNYRSDGKLVPRNLPQALVLDVEEATERALRAVSEGKVKSVEGVDIEVAVDTIYIHGDSPHAIELAMSIRRRFAEAGISIKPLKVFVR